MWECRIYDQPLHDVINFFENKIIPPPPLGQRFLYTIAQCSSGSRSEDLEGARTKFSSVILAVNFHKHGVWFL